MLERRAAAQGQIDHKEGNLRDATPEAPNEPRSEQVSDVNRVASSDRYATLFGHRHNGGFRQASRVQTINVVAVHWVWIAVGVYAEEDDENAVQYRENSNERVARDLKRSTDVSTRKPVSPLALFSLLRQVRRAWARLLVFHRRILMLPLCGVIILHYELRLRHHCLKLKSWTAESKLLRLVFCWLAADFLIY